MLAALCHVVLVSTHLRLFGGLFRLLLALSGTALGGLAVVLAVRLVLPLKGLTWLTLWFGLTAVMLTGSLALKCHEVGAANRARIALSTNFRQENRSSLSWFRFGKRASLLRACYDIQERSRAIRLSLGQHVGRALARNTPRRLMGRRVHIDPYELARADAELARAERYAHEQEREIARFVAWAETRLRPHMHLLPPGTHLAESFMAWSISSLRIPEDLRKQGLVLLSREESLLRCIHRDRDAVRCDARGLPRNPLDKEFPNSHMLQELEREVREFVHHCVPAAHGRT